MVGFVQPSDESQELADVIALGRRAKATVGFLPDAAFAQRAQQGTLLAATVDGAVAAYVLYDLPRDEIRIVQLVVAPERRGQGIARALVDRVAVKHAHRRGIFLSCRNDFPADKLWPKLDFVPLQERPGRNLEGKPLTRWFRSFGQPDLFTFLHEQDTRPIAVMDTCVFLDVVAVRPKAIAQQLRADWLIEHVRLAVVDQLLIEVRDGTDASERRRQAKAAQPLQLPDGASAKWRPTYAALRDAHPTAPEADLKDLKHVAQSIAARASWLITADRRFARRYGATAKELSGLRLVSAAEFLREVDELARGDRYRPVELAGTDVTRRQADASSLRELAGAFVNHPDGERIRDLRAIVDRAAAHPMGTSLELIEVDGSPRGLICWQQGEQRVEVLLARVTAGPAEGTIGRHLLAMVRDDAIRSGRETIRVLDKHPSPGVQASFRDEGFALADDGVVVAHAFHGHGSLSQLHRRAEELRSPLARSGLFAPPDESLVDRAAAAERWFAPFVVTDAEIPTYFVPIQHGWATDLVDSGLAEDQLLSRPWRLGLRRELVYYRSPRNSRNIAAPARIVWYVSGTAPGARCIRAVSHLTEVITDVHERLFHRFRSLGVYEASDVAGAADRRGVAMALRFTSTRRIGPVSLDAYREVLTGDPKSRDVVLRSIHPIDEHMFVRLLELGPPRDA